MNQLRLFRALAFATGACLFTPDALGSAVTNWHTFKNTATVLSGQGTDGPVMGSTANSSSTGFLIGYMDSPLSLNAVGDRISLTFNMSFNDAAGMASSANDNLRFALFDLNGEAQVTIDNTATAGTTDTDNLRGYWFGVRTSATGGSIRRRTDTGANPFANGTNPLLGTPGGSAVTYSGAINGVGGQTYVGELTLIRTIAGVDLSGFFGGNGATNSFSFSDTSGSITNGFQAVGFFNGSALNLDQMILQNVDVSYFAVPEPSAAALGFGGLLGLMIFRLERARRRFAGNRHNSSSQ